MKITVRTFTVTGGFVVGYRRQRFVRGVCVATTVEYVGVDGFWTREIHNANPFGSESAATRAADDLSPRY